MRVTRTVVVNRSPEELWPHLHEPDEMLRWMPRLVKVIPHDSSSAMGPGARFLMKIQEPRKVADYEGEILTYEPPERLRLKLWGGSFKEAETMFGEYRLEDLGGRTRLVYDVQKDLEGWLLNALTPFIWLLGFFHLGGVLRALKRAAEGSGQDRPAPSTETPQGAESDE